MTVLDTDFLVALLRGNTDATELAERINFPKTTIINAFELYYGAKRSKKSEASLSEVISLLDSIEVPVNILDVLIAGIVKANNEEVFMKKLAI
jgi:predicted nucleic acid-binding protein